MEARVYADGGALQGEADPEKLADLGLAFVPTKREALAKALCGRMHEHQRFVLRELLQMIDAQEWAIARLDRQIEERLRPFEATIKRLDAMSMISKKLCHLRYNFLLAWCAWHA